MPSTGAWLDPNGAESAPEMAEVRSGERDGEPSSTDS